MAAGSGPGGCWSPRGAATRRWAGRGAGGAGGDGGGGGGGRVRVTPGLVAELLDVPGVRERWGREVLDCPYCHGWEVRDQPIGVLASGPRAVHQALVVRAVPGRP